MTAGPRLAQLTTVLLAVGFIALSLIVVTTLHLGERAQITFDEAILARDVRAAATEARAAVQTAESSQRGYVLTGNQIYLAPYGTAKAAAERELEIANARLAGDPRAEPVLRRLAEIVGEKFAEMDRVIALKRERRDAEALAVIRTNRGKALTDEANVFFSGIARAADERLTGGISEQRVNASRLRWTTIAGGLLIVAVVAVVVLAGLHHTRELAAARAEVETLNRDLERRVAERTADLARANHEIQHFAHVVSHDLRAPLVSIVGFAGELEGAMRSVQAVVTAAEERGAAGPIIEQARFAANEDVPEAIRFIRSAARKMEVLIAGVLTLSREGRRTLRSETVAVAELVRTSAEAIRYQIAMAGGDLELDLDLPQLVTDRASLEQVVTNILDNAIKYRSPDRPLRIDVRGRQLAFDRVGLEFEDNGRGIGPTDLERVFDLFARAGKPDQPGEGVGLAHVRTLVRNLGGEVSVSSELDRGTIFRITLPRDLDAHAAFVS